MLRFLTLVRHAKSSWKDAALDDADRPLNKRGKRDAPEMGKRLAKLGAKPSVIISSPAKRARKTAWTIAQALGYPRGKVVERPAVYLATVDDLLSVLGGIDKEIREVILVGHNPGITNLANFLTGEDIYNIPTCGVARIRFEDDDWASLGPRSGKLELLDTPKSSGR
ncbi:MAG: histidine phosphatase family protein [Pseudomonadota bacterium]|nr:histidine phosphatase family protein [Pseudomonadota bacterium]